MIPTPFVRHVALWLVLSMAVPAWALRAPEIQQRPKAGLEALSEALGTPPIVASTVERITLPGVRGPIALTITLPAGPAPHPVLLFFPGYADDDSNPLYDEVLAPFHEAGYATVIADLSQGSAAPSQFSPDAQLDDVGAVLACLKNQHADRLALKDGLAIGGYSLGGYLALWVAALASQGDPRLTVPLRTVVRFSSTIDLVGTFAVFRTTPASTRLNVELTPDRFPEFGGLDAATLLSQISPEIRCLEVVGAADQLILGAPVEGVSMGEYAGVPVFASAQRYFEALEVRGTPVRLWPGVRHNYLHSLAPSGVAREIGQWMAAQVSATAGLESSSAPATPKTFWHAGPTRDLPNAAPESLDDRTRAVVKDVEAWSARVLAPLSDRINTRDGNPVWDSRAPGGWPSPALQDAVREAATAGYLGAAVPSEYGGTPQSTVARAAQMVAMWRVNPSAALTIDVARSLAVLVLVASSSDALKREILPQLVAGTSTMAYAITEPEHGTDVLNRSTVLGTRAALDAGGHWQLSGEKQFITNAGFADWLVVLASTDEVGEKSFFLVSKQDVDIVYVWTKNGLPGTSLANVRFREGATGRLIGQRGGGIALAFAALNPGRISIAAGSTGLAQAAQRATVRWAVRERQINGRPQAEIPTVQQYLAQISAYTYAMEALLGYVSALADAGRLNEKGLETAIAKVWNSQVLTRQIALQAVQVAGGRGFISEAPDIGVVARVFVDASPQPIYEGANDALTAQVIARQVPLEALLDGWSFPDDSPLARECQAVREAARLVTAARQVLGEVSERQQIYREAWGRMVAELYAMVVTIDRTQRLVEQGLPCRHEVNLTRLVVTQGIQRIRDELELNGEAYFGEQSAERLRSLALPTNRVADLTVEIAASLIAREQLDALAEQWGLAGEGTLHLVAVSPAIVQTHEELRAVVGQPMTIGRLQLLIVPEPAAQQAGIIARFTRTAAPSSRVTVFPYGATTDPALTDFLAHARDAGCTIEAHRSVTQSSLQDLLRTIIADVTGMVPAAIANTDLDRLSRILSTLA